MLLPSPSPRRGRPGEGRVRSHSTESASLAEGHDEYAVVRALCLPEYREYVRLLGRCYRQLCELKAGRNGSAVATALMLLQETTTYVRGGHCADMTACRPGMKPEQQAIFLWQQIVSGTNRQIPYLHRDAYTHGGWSRFNVVEVWRYRVGKNIGVDDVWGLSGFAPRFVGDSTNTNQIEHMAITAVAQIVLRIPVLLLDILEELEWMLRKGTKAASQADKLVNRAVARQLLPVYNLQDPERACELLEKELSCP